MPVRASLRLWSPSSDGWRRSRSRAGLTGRFTGRTEGSVQAGERVELERVAGLGVEAAISWARERAGLMLVRFGRRDEYWSAAATPHWRYAPWPRQVAAARPARVVRPRSVGGIAPTQGRSERRTARAAERERRSREHGDREADAGEHRRDARLGSSRVRGDRDPPCSAGVDLAGPAVERAVARIAGRGDPDRDERG